MPFTFRAKKKTVLIGKSAADINAFGLATYCKITHLIRKPPATPRFVSDLIGNLEVRFSHVDA